jgi:hypothetical protein
VHRSQPVLLSISFLKAETTKGQSCEAVTYRKKRVDLQPAKLTKHFSLSSNARNHGAGRSERPK